jgi:hypothetical protein
VNADKLASDILSQFKALLGNRWAKFNATERRIVTACTVDAAALNAQIFTGQLTPAQAQREKAQILAQIANLKSAAEAGGVELFNLAIKLALKGLFAVMLA